MTRADPEYGHLIPLLEEYASTGAGDPRRETLRAELVTGFLPVAQHIARRFSNRGEPLDDLVERLARTVADMSADDLRKMANLDLKSFGDARAVWASVEGWATEPTGASDPAASEVMAAATDNRSTPD